MLFGKKSEKLDCDDYYRRFCSTCADEACAGQAADPRWANYREPVFRTCQAKEMYRPRAKLGEQKTG